MSFLKNSTVVSNLKLRLGYGVTGQQDGISDYDYISYYNLSDAKANYQIGNTYYQMYRPGGYYQNRKWEQTATYNVAIDYGFLNDRITGSLEYYYKKTTDLLNQIDQPVLTNFANKIVANVGDMENNGVEFTINVQSIKSKKLIWDVSFNATYNQNKITKLTINSNPSYAGNQYGGISGGTGSTININSVGNARGSFYVYKQIYDQTTGKPIENLYVDFNNDGIMDKYVFKSIDPKMFFGFNTNVSYLKWSAGFSMRANLGNYVYNNVASANGVRSKILFSTYLSNSNTDVLNTNFVGTGDYYYSNYYVQNASFLKMDNIHLGFNLGKLHNSNVNLRFNASVQNVFTITKYTGVDPEISSGIDNNQYPRPRTVVFGASLDF
jgi:iron complex outermembrane receptor protein